MNMKMVVMAGAMVAAVGVAAVAHAEDSGWSSWFSDGSGPVYCDSHERVGATECYSHYCDFMRIFCVDTTPLHNGQDVIRQFSDETWGGTDCSGYAGLARSEISAMACTGDYCDNMWIRCSQRESGEHANCSWTNWVSEEGAGLNWFVTKHARGAQCAGSYCDSLRYWICDAS
jgi:hypothetical protein